MMPDKGIAATVYEVSIQNECTDVKYPQIRLANHTVQEKINDQIKEQLLYLFPGEGCEVYQTILGTYKIGVNRDSVLSVVLDMGTYIKEAANGRDEQKVSDMTSDLATGKEFYFFELFKPGSYFKGRIDQIILNQIQEQHVAIISAYPGVTDYQEYYLTESALVVYFQELVFTPHSSGIPEFTIPYAQIADIVRTDPIGRLTATGR